MSLGTRARSDWLTPTSLKEVPHLKSVLVGITLTLIASFALASPAHAAPLVCECIRWLREAQGVNIRGDAWTIRPNQETAFARVGDVILFDYAKEDDGALIIGLHEPTPGNTIATIVEANYSRCRVTNRNISIFDPSVKGIYRSLSTGTVH